MFSDIQRLPSRRAGDDQQIQNSTFAAKVNSMLADIDDTGICCTMTSTS
ncbi:MAG: hypothetical protein WAO83_22870 [Fuerstiella sp.]